MRVIRFALAWAALSAAAAPGSPVQQAPASAAAIENPMAGNDAARRAGAKLYARECQACHGANRQGSGKAPPLARTDIYHAAPGALSWVLRNGALRQGMPSFAHLPEAQRWQIVTFLEEKAPGASKIK